MTRLPLLIDVHSHVHRGAEWEHKGTLETETKSALTSGFGTVIAMPNSCPPVMTQLELTEARKKAGEQSYCDVGFHFGSVGDNFTQFPHVWPLVYGLKVYLGETTGGYNVSVDTAEKIFEAWIFDRPILVHAEGASSIKHMLRLAKRHGQRLHVCHVALAEEVDVIRKAKRSGQQVTAEVSPHHCIFTKNDLPQLGSYGIMKPPLGTGKDVEAIWSGIKNGVIDIIATDHAPHSTKDKELGAFGVISEPAFSVMWKACSERRVSLDHLAFMMHFTPARIFSVPYSHAESYMEVDLDDEFEVKKEMIQSKAGRSPYEGMKVRGRIRKIHLHGTLVYQDGEFLAREGRVI